MNTPGVIEVYGRYFRPLGPRGEGAGLGVRFQPTQARGIHFTVEPPEEYRAFIISGIEDAMAARFPSFLSTGSVSITEITDDGINSSQQAFYRAAGMAVEQAFALAELRKA